MLYSIVIIFCMTLISGLNMLFNPLYQDQVWIYILFTIGFTVMAVVIDGIVAFVIRKMPEELFEKNKGIFKTGERELAFYEFLRVKKWKDYVPELGCFTGFHKNKLANPFDNKYIWRFIIESRYGVAIHFYSVPTSFLLLLLDWRMYSGESNIWLTIGLPVAIINAILIVLPAFILKYNLPRLLRIYDKNAAAEAKKNQINQ